MYMYAEVYVCSMLIAKKINLYKILSIYRTAVKDRIVSFLLFLGKLAITCAMGESMCAYMTLYLLLS